MLIFSHLIICNPHSREKSHYSDNKLHRVQGLPKATCMRGEDLGPRDPLARNPRGHYTKKQNFNQVLSQPANQIHF